ncbi:MAG: sigma 54-interacting transcriptional regulator [Bacillota bacterium]
MANKNKADNKEKQESTAQKVTRLSEIELEKMIDSIDEAIIGCDKDGLVNIYNRANERREKMSRKQVLNRPVNDIYDFHSGQSLLLQAISKRKPILDQYQEYTLYDSGVYVEILCSTVPIMEGDEVIGAVSVMKDYSSVKKLSKIIMDLHSNLLDSNQKKTNKPGGAIAKHYFSDIIGNNRLLRETLQWAQKTASNDLPVLIAGETGTGKELLAQGIHNASNRKDQPFIAINCAAIPENLLEGLLFGTVKGAFTGAVDRPGLFEQASEGTLVLDEINSMSLALQTKLLRVIQENAVRRVGDLKERSINTRLISISNTEPDQAIKEGALREDLYYRIAYISLHMPPLRERLDDLPILVDYLIGKYNCKLSLNVQGLSAELLSLIEHYSWPGNIREMEQFLAAGMSALESGKKVIGLNDIPPNISRKFASGTENLKRGRSNYSLENTLDRVERRVVKTALKRNNWNVSKTAKELGLKRQSLQYRIKKYSLEFS